MGDPITKTIQRKIHDADFLVPFLSTSSANSKWVKQEMLEALYIELQTEGARLLPCVIEKCELPEIFTKLKRYERLYLDFTKDFDTAVSALTTRLGKTSSSALAKETYLGLSIDVPGLEIYMTGDTWDWGTNSQLRYQEMLDGYLLFGFRQEPWAYFKHFVLCEEKDASRVREQLQNAGFDAGGSGDRDPGTRKRRVWFTLPNYQVEGSQRNNRWPG